jgi:hypothetical protein
MEASEYLLGLLFLVAIAGLSLIAQVAPSGTGERAGQPSRSPKSGKPRKVPYWSPRICAHISITLPRSTISEGLR